VTFTRSTPSWPDLESVARRHIHDPVAHRALVACVAVHDGLTRDAGVGGDESNGRGEGVAGDARADFDERPTATSATRALSGMTFTRSTPVSPVWSAAQGDEDHAGRAGVEGGARDAGDARDTPSTSDVAGPARQPTHAGATLMRRHHAVAQPSSHASHSSPRCGQGATLSWPTTLVAGAGDARREHVARQ
jgi:hypothetical protein